MIRKIQYILVLFFCFQFVQSVAQTDICMTSHWYNRMGYNPAFIARTDYAYIFSNYRDQWVGVDGAPRVYTVQVSEYIHSLHSAVGLSFINDKVGATQALNPMFNYAFQIVGKKEWSLSMGLAGGVFSRTVNGNLFEADVINDPSINYNTQEELKPDANAGIEFQNSSFIFGVSSTHLFSLNKPGETFLNSNHRYGYAIYKNNNIDAFYYKLGIMVVNRYNLTMVEGNAFIRFKHGTGLKSGPREIFDIGLSYRSSRQLTSMLGILLRPDLRVGYAYDHSFIKGYYTNSTHEFFIEYRIPNKLASTKPRCGKEIHWYH